MKRWIAAVSTATALVVSSCSTSDSGTSTKSTAAAGSSTTAKADAPATTAAEVTTTKGPEVTTTAPAKAANPFTGTDAFCKAGGAAPAGLTATGNGVTADTITVVHVRQKLEELEKIGFSVPVGDPDDIVRVLFGEINKCGGINGRKVEVKTVEFSPLDPATREKVCVAATEDVKSFGVISGTGWAGPGVVCVAADKGTVVVSSTGVPEADYVTAKGRIVTADVTQEGSLRAMADAAIGKKALEGKKVGVVAGDLNGLDKVVQTGLVDYLKSKGVNVVSFEVIACAGKSSCTDGVATVVENMRNAGVEVLFPTLNIVSLPQLIKEAATQGLKPVIFQSNFNSMAGDLTSSKVFDFGGEDAAKLYNGATVIDWPTTGAYRVPGYKPPAFGEMCADAYGKNTTKGTRPDAAKESTIYGMVQTMCSNIRIFARAAHDAGPALTGDAWAAAAAKLGDVDMNGGITGKIEGKKLYGPTEVRFGTITYPCPDPAYKLCAQPTADPPVKIAG
jgi:ABC-type branched-subunit amino acid transport system substrate-binding protein